MRVSFLVLLLLAVAAAQVQAREVRGTQDYLARMDGNDDGRVSMTEYQDWLSYAFDAMDRNNDGALTRDELPGGKGATITRAQHRARLASTFKKQDANRDGYLSSKELSAPPR